MLGLIIYFLYLHIFYVLESKLNFYL